MSDRRLYYRHRTTGDLGYLFELDGKQVIHLDRIGDEEANLRPFIEQQWQPEEVRRPLTRHQLAIIAWDADKSLCRMLGQGHEARKEWLSLSDAARQQWIAFGPEDGSIRDRLFDSIQKALEGDTGE